MGRLLRRTVGLEQLCDECSRTYLAKPDAHPIEQFVSGSAVASVFLEQKFGKRTFYVKFGRTMTDGHRLFVSDLLQEEHLRDVTQAAAMAYRFIREQKSLRLVSR